MKQSNTSKPNLEKNIQEYHAGNTVTQTKIQSLMKK